MGFPAKSSLFDCVVKEIKCCANCTVFWYESFLHWHFDDLSTLWLTFCAPFPVSCCDFLLCVHLFFKRIITITPLMQHWEWFVVCSTVSACGEHIEGGGFNAFKQIQTRQMNFTTLAKQHIKIWIAAIALVHIVSYCLELIHTTLDESTFVLIQWLTSLVSEWISVF